MFSSFVAAVIRSFFDSSTTVVRLFWNGSTFLYSPSTTAYTALFTRAARIISYSKCHSAIIIHQDHWKRMNEKNYERERERAREGGKKQNEKWAFKLLYFRVTCYAKPPDAHFRHFGFKILLRANAEPICMRVIFVTCRLNYMKNYSPIDKQTENRNEWMNGERHSTRMFIWCGDN